MKKFVVGITDLFENNLELYIVTSENEYDAIKHGLISRIPTDRKEELQAQIEYQKSEIFPKTKEELIDACFDADLIVNVIEI